MNNMTKNYLFVVFIFAMIFLTVIRVKTSYIKNKKIDTEFKIVKYPLAILILGLFSSSLFTIELINNYKNQGVFGNLFFAFWVIIGVFLVVLQTNFCIFYDKEKIVYSGLFKKIKTYEIKDIIKISEKGNTIYIWFSDGSKIDFNYDFCIGSIDFYIFINNALKSKK